MKGRWRVPRRAELALLAGLCATALVPATAGAAVRVKHDKPHEVRFELDGRTLTTTVVDLPRYMQDPPTLRELSGQRVRVACGTSFRHIRRSTVLVRQVVWPRGARSVTVEFRRDLSRGVKWCVIDGEDGGDVAFVSFHRAERPRPLASGLLLDGTRWRLAAWRGEKLQPCVALRVAGEGSSGYCFDDEAETEAGIEAFFDVPSCSGGTFVLGAVSRAAKRVEVRLDDGQAVPATLWARPRGSRVKAQYFGALLASPPNGRPADVAAVIAYDVRNRPIARDRGINGGLCDRRGERG